MMKKLFIAGGIALMALGAGVGYIYVSELKIDNELLIKQNEKLERELDDQYQETYKVFNHKPYTIKAVDGEGNEVWYQSENIPEPEKNMSDYFKELFGKKNQ